MANPDFDHILWFLVKNIFHRLHNLHPVYYTVHLDDVLLLNFLIDYLRLTVGVFGQPREHPRGAVLTLPALPDAPWRVPRGAVAATGHGRQRRLQEPRLALRADSARGGGLRALRLLPTLGHPASQEPGALLGDPHGYLPNASG